MEENAAELRKEDKKKIKRKEKIGLIREILNDGYRRGSQQQSYGCENSCANFFFH